MKVLNKFIKILTTILLALSILLLCFSVYGKIAKKDISIFGYSFHIVLTSSMDNPNEKPVIKKGDFIIAKKVDFNSIDINDVIVYNTKLDDNLNNGIKRIVHQVIEKKTDENGNTYFITKGTANLSFDKENVTDVIGVYKFRSAFLGKIFRFLKNPINIAFLIIILFSIYIATKQIVKIKNELTKDKKE